VAGGVQPQCLHTFYVCSFLFARGKTTIDLEILSAARQAIWDDGTGVILQDFIALLGSSGCGPIIGAAMEARAARLCRSR
jgi:hypothetical protein